jgi:transcriptional regulator with XRE-family HTH domain
VTNRIRHYRKRRGMTLAQVAGQLGTTPQTVSRLETEAMTLSMDWLRRFADIFDVHVADLLEAPGEREIPSFGAVTGDGQVTGVPESLFALDVPSARPVALRITESLGPYEAGEILILSQYENDMLDRAAGGDCLVCLTDGNLLFRRLIRDPEGRYSLVPVGAGGEVLHACAVDWAARVVMRVRYV